MPITGHRTTADDVRNFEAGPLLLGAGALLLFVGLFLDWYKPGFDAWTVFEVWDLALAATAVVALVAAAGRMGFTQRRPNAWLVSPAALALVVVLVELLDPPPAAVGGDPATGIWLALAAAALMALGAVLSVARISVAVNIAGPPEKEPTAEPPPPRAPLAPDPDAEAPTATRPRRRIVARPGAADDPSYPDEPTSSQRPPTAPTRRH
jgi:hypothetical protein